MKKLVYLFAIMLTLTTVSCEKDKEDDSPTFTQSELNGTWAGPEADGCVISLIITDNSCTENSKCGMSNISTEFTDYKFDGKSITGNMSGIPVTITIKELSETQMVAVFSSLLGASTTTYTKVP